ncbi:MAG: ArsR/SmtB family transcription factor [Ignavibacteriaceae bacterium]
MKAKIKKMIKNLTWVENSPMAKKILQTLADNGEMNVTEIYVKLRMEQDVVSQFLSPLRELGFVDVRKDGKYRYYTANVKKRQMSVKALNKLHLELNRHEN